MFCCRKSKSSSLSRRIQVKCLGVDADIFDEHGNTTKDKGELVCKSSIPSMPIGFWNDSNKKKYISSYFSTFENIWSQGDFAQYLSLIHI